MPGIPRVVRCLGARDQWMMAGGELVRRDGSKFRNFLGAALVRARAAALA
jgi:hypothetical protein